MDEFVPVHRTIADRAAEAPDKPAVTDEWTSLTYRELTERADELAGVLIRQGLRPGGTVAVHMESSAAILVALLAVSRAGGASLMLDVSGPRQWLTGFVERALPVAWITHESSPEPPFTGTVHRLDEGGRVKADDGPVPDFPEVGPEDMACLVQTSGSTGVPKLVLVPHRTWTYATATQEELHRIDRDDRGAWLFPSHTNVSVSVVFWPFLAAGAHLSIPPREIVSAPEELALWIRDQRITQVFAVAPLAEALARLDWPTCALRLMLTGSDRVREWGRPELPFEIGNWYGANEVNIVTSPMVPWAERITSATATAADRAGTPPIGRVWPGANWRVVDAHDRLVAPGEVGELLVGGRQLALGYLSARATAEKFLPDPQAAEPGSRIYRTGDMVRVRPDGALEHCGRIDDQVQINGKRVEMGEVERAMLTYPGIREAAATTVESRTGRPQLVGYLVTSAPVVDAELRRAMADALPSHMVPVAFVRMEKLPRNRGDKIDRRALPHPEAAAADRANHLNALAVSVLSEVLDRESCASDDNFFLLGGDSLLAVAAARRLTQKAGRPVAAQDIFLNPTPGELGAFLRTAPVAAHRR
jgi:amino acid adenylation domain-containing protein|uniref:Long-chain-fatty-acid--CoA ligase n=1 Tax=uncultured bacterium esnapd7 TaxID=1366614 RepID=S5UC80_9BACT|nr:long-chain-fatty-acid--CoA ligase [uncultured bacterium esnapd7]